MCDIYLPIDYDRNDIVLVGSIMGYNSMEGMLKFLFFRWNSCCYHHCCCHHLYLQSSEVVQHIDTECGIYSHQNHAMYISGQYFIIITITRILFVTHKWSHVF